MFLAVSHWPDLLSSPQVTVGHMLVNQADAGVDRSLTISVHSKRIYSRQLGQLEPQRKVGIAIPYPTAQFSTRV